MKILLLSFYYQPDFCAGSFRAEALVNALQQHPAVTSILLLTTKPQRYGRKKNIPDREHVGKLSVTRYAIPQHGNRLYRQIITYSIFAIKSLTRALHSKPEFDLILTTSSRLGTSSLGHIISKLTRRPHFVDMRDIFSDNLKSVFTPSTMTRLIIKMLEKQERAIVYHAQWINFVSPGFLDYFPNNLLGEKTRVFTNGIDPIFIEKRKYHIVENKPKTKNTQLKLVYAGNIGLGQRLEKIIIPLAIRFSEEIEFTIIGDGSAARILKDEIRKKQIVNINMIEPVPREELIEFYYQADVLFVHLADIPAFSKVIPSKIFEYASTNKPILAGVRGVSRNFLEKEVSHAYLFDPDDVDGAAAHITKLMIKPVVVDRSEFIEKYSRETIMQDMIKDLVTAYGN